ncbi:amino acid adenylation domain-containing protein [Streptantibioticus ferralitis]|uniref:Amino acid adenylation domain-containing protein n=1 Tax=Streptantibioticus ferralitis TaxID=236510 RepID=A0ABT5Z1W1_9ACTN|nr:amino acid adenylation domain-containing protein [Streptantibioticus ferralitis]MDF2257758.1 amino acid adenylation domain-containing protein [Streptantibioticus ferralitis]
MAKDIEDIYPLSPIQQGLMFEQLYRSGTGIYIEHLLIGWEGRLDPARFEQAWQAVVDRHPILRTTFHWQGDRALQVVHRSARLPLEVLDWRELPAEEQEQRLKSWLTRERIEGFALDRAPLMRNTVIRRSETEWTFAWRFSHLLMDGWSFGLAMQEFAHCYRALCRGERPELPQAPGYRNYLAWWQAQDPAKDAEFWRGELAGYVQPEPLHLDGAPVPENTATHAFLELELSELAPGLRTLARERQLTLNTLVQGAWLLVLSRYHGHQDVACGATIAHRPADLAAGQSILGPMIVTLPVRERLDPHRALLPWLADFQTHMAAVREHSRLPLVEIQRLAGQSPDAPLLETSVSFENVPMPDLALDDVGLAVRDIFYDGRPHFPITMVIMPGEEMPLRIVYDLRRFAPDAAQRIADHLVSVLRQMVQRPELTLGEVRLSTGGPTEPEREPLTGPAETLAESFARQVRERPDAVAVRCDGKELTYRHLDVLADDIASRLRAAGARRGSRVGLCLGRSAELIATMVAAFKVGAAYVPLDPEHPADRLAEILADAEVNVVATVQELADRLPGFTGRTVLVDTEPVPAPRADGSPEAATPDDAAYVLYTSGSTGRPKGVIVTHANVQSLLAAGRDEFGFTADDTWTFTHSHTFDYSVWEIWGALAHGGRLVVVPHWTARSPEELLALVRQEAVTVLSLTPAVFEHFAGAALADPATDTGRLRQVFLGGDRLEPEVLRPWAERFGLDHPTIHNLYGVTEATVVSTSHQVTQETLAARTPVPIGTPLPNQRVALLDSHGRPVPMGARGELCLIGPAVARGYLARPELTAERFTAAPDPLYRTGDLARLRADGAIEFLGRSDAQVKVRGFRIELGEIEAVLREHPAVRTALVVRQNQHLAAYLVPAGEQVPGTAVHEYAAERLPDYMVPAAVGWLDRIPTTVGGKVDTAALPRLERPDDAEFVAPRTASERHLAELLADILNTERVGVYDRLAELGMHSLAAMRLAARLRDETRTQLPLRALLEAPTLESLARAVDATTTSNGGHHG